MSAAKFPQFLYKKHKTDCEMPWKTLHFMKLRKILEV